MSEDQETGNSTEISQETGLPTEDVSLGQDPNASAPDGGEVQEKGLDREEQSFKDRFYSLSGKYEALVERMERVETKTVEPVKEAASDEERWLSRVDEELGDVPVVKDLIRDVLAVKKQLVGNSAAQQRGETGRVAETLETFEKETNFAKLPQSVKDEFVADLDDRLPDGVDMNAIFAAIQKGRPLPVGTAEMLSRKLKRSFSVVSGKQTGDPVKRAEAEKKADAMTRSNGGGFSTKTAAASAPTEPRNLAEARAYLKKAAGR